MCRGLQKFQQWSQDVAYVVREGLKQYSTLNAQVVIKTVKR